VGQELLKGQRAPRVFQRSGIELSRAVSSPLFRLVNVFSRGAQVDAMRDSGIDAATDCRGARLEPVVEIRRVDKIGFRGDHIVAQLTGTAQQVAPPGEHVVHDLRGVGAGPDEEEGAGVVIVHHRVVDEVEFIERVPQALAP
jgi:hypothetical protein